MKATDIRHSHITPPGNWKQTRSPGKSWEHRGAVGVRGRGEEEREGRRGGLEKAGSSGMVEMKDVYGSREEDTLIKGAFLGLARDLALEGFPGVHGDVPS